MTSFLFAMVFIFWFGTAAFSRKRLARIKEKDGKQGVALALTLTLWLFSCLACIIALIINESGSEYHFELVNGTLYFMLAVLAVLLIEFLVFTEQRRWNDKNK